MKTAILHRKLVRFGTVLTLALVTAFGSLTMQAQPRGRPMHPHPGFVVQSPPRGFVTLNFGNSFFYMSGGVFYQRAPHGFVVVNPPVGLHMWSLPFGAQRVWFNGAVFYNYNNVFFQPAFGGGFVVVNPPFGSVFVAPPPVVVRPMPPPVIVRPMPPPPMRPVPPVRPVPPIGRPPPTITPMPMPTVPPIR